MASTIAFDIIAKDRASDKFDKLGDSADKSSGKLKTFAKVGALAAAGAAVVAGKALFDMTKSAIEDAKSQEILAKTLKNAASATDAQVASVESWITAQGKALGVADDELRPAMQRLTEATGDVGKAQKLSSLAMDISAGTGKSLKTVSEALAKAQMGQVGGLSRYGIATRNAAGEMMTFDEVTKKASKTFSGQASTAANTAEGKFKRLSLQFDEAKESIGAKLLPIAIKLADWMLADFIPAVEKAASWLGKHLPPAIDKVKSGFEKLARAGKWMWNNVLQPAFKALAVAIAFILDMWSAMLGTLGKVPGFGWAKDAAKAMGDAAEKARAVADGIKKIPSGKTVNVTVAYRYVGRKNGVGPIRSSEGAADPDSFLPRNAAAVLSRTASQVATSAMAAMAKAFRDAGPKTKKALEDNLTRMREALRTARDDMKSLSESIASALTPDAFGFTDLAAEFDSATGAMTAPAQSALQQMMAQLTGTHGALAGLTAVFDKLKGSVSKGFLSSVMQSGNIGLMQQLAADPAAAAQASRLFEANAAMAQGLGDKTAESVMGEKVERAIREEIKKLRDEAKDAPEKTAKKIRDLIRDLRLEVTGVDPASRAYLRTGRR